VAAPRNSAEADWLQAQHNSYRTGYSEASYAEETGNTSASSRARPVTADP
jgi:hypothetical protein